VVEPGNQGLRQVTRVDWNRINNEKRCQVNKEGAIDKRCGRDIFSALWAIEFVEE
jgi:hypothetical protein